MDSEWLKTQFRVHPDKNKAGLARAMGVEPPAISKILSGTRQIKAHEYHAMRRYFGLPVDGDRSVSGSFGAGRALDAGQDAYVLAPLGRAMEENAQPQDGESWVMPAHLLNMRTKAAPEKIRIFEIPDDSMTPDFKPGEHVLVNTEDTKPSPAGKFVIWDGVGYILRQCEVVPQTTPVMIRLRPLNASYESHTLPFGKADIIGRAIARLEWL